MPISLRAKGFTCIGSDLKPKHLIHEPCPEQVTIDLNTAFLRVIRRGDESRLRLETRCIRCRANWRIKRINKTFARPRKELDVNFPFYRQQVLETASKPWVLHRTEYRTRVRRPVIRIRSSAERQPVYRKAVVIDCEWTLPDQRLSEVAIIDRATDEVLINTLIKRSKPAKVIPPLKAR